MIEYDKLIDGLWSRARRKRPFIAQGEIWTGGMVKDELCAEAATVIETLRVENAKLRSDWEKYQPREHWETLNEAVANLRATLARVTAERDAAVEDLLDAAITPCSYCERNPSNGGTCDMDNDNHEMFSCWKWRGIEED